MKNRLWSRGALQPILALFAGAVGAHAATRLRGGGPFAEAKFPERIVLFSMTTCFGCAEGNLAQARNALLGVLEVEGGSSLLREIVVVNEVKFSTDEPDWGQEVTEAVPDCTVSFIQKDGEEQRGQAHSLNMILGRLRTSGAPYWLQWEESWVPQRPFLRRALGVLAESPTLWQVELLSDPTWTRWNSDRVHELAGAPWFGHVAASNASFACDFKRWWPRGWPLFSLHPAVNRAEAMLLVGNFSTDPCKWPTVFEFEWACGLLNMGGQKGMLLDHSIVRQKGHVSSYCGGEAHDQARAFHYCGGKSHSLLQLAQSECQT